MELSILLFGHIVSMMLIASAGFILGRAKLMTAEQSRALSCVCIYLSMPCGIVISFSAKPEPGKLAGLGLGLAAAVLIHLLYLLLGRAFARRPFAMTPEERASVIYNNAGNLIMPMVQNVLGAEYVLYTSPYLLVQNLLLWTHGQKLMGGEQKLNWKKIAANPSIDGIGIGLILLMTGISLPGPLYKAMEGLSACTAPLCMLATGIVLSELELKKAFLQARIYWVSLVRLVLLPVLCAGILLGIHRLFPMQDGANVFTVSLLSAIGPSASVTVQQAQLFRNPNVGHVSSINVMTTILCAVTMPFITLLFRLLL